MHNSPSAPQDLKSGGQAILNFVSLVAGESNSIQKSLRSPLKARPGWRVGTAETQAGKCQCYGSLSDSGQGYYHYSF